MDSQSLFLTANADTVYYLGFVDLTGGPMVVETPPASLGIFDDMWFQWIIDFGLPGPDRGAGGKYLLVPPGYDGALPDSGFHVGRSGTHRALILDRSFLQDNDPKPTADLVKSTLEIAFIADVTNHSDHSSAATVFRTPSAASRSVGPAKRCGVADPASDQCGQGDHGEDGGHTANGTVRSAIAVRSALR
ncbi:DUF1254 domain-containing protein [Nocardia sp. NBC_00403]|uniref:DUF1254 domain-containing protein n=1 Tax=Nocardia sp. NBC_00403 TaxID=2975990 RepID=UPI002E21B61F